MQSYPHPSPLPRGEGACSGCRASGVGPWTAHRRVPLDKRVSRRNPTSVGRISGGEDLWCYLPKRAGLSKVTRPGPKGGRNPVEGGALAFHAAKPHRIKGSTAGSGIRRESVVVEQTISCGAMRCAYCTLRCSIAWRSRATTSRSRTSDYASLIRPTEKPIADAG